LITDDRATVIRRYGFVTEWVRWQILTFSDAAASTGTADSKEEPMTTSDTARSTAVKTKRKRDDMNNLWVTKYRNTNFWSIKFHR
jgi:hypothetical protein